MSLGNFFVPIWNVPSFTLPFNCAALLFLGAASESQSFPQPFRPALLLSANRTEAASYEDWSVEVDWGQALEAVPKGIGQVFLADSTASGALIGAALILCSPIAAAMAVR